MKNGLAISGKNAINNMQGLHRSKGILSFAKKNTSYEYNRINRKKHTSSLPTNGRRIER
jgi:hypothetical protein